MRAVLRAPQALPTAERTHRTRRHASVSERRTVHVDSKGADTRDGSSPATFPPAPKPSRRAALSVSALTLVGLGTDYKCDAKGVDMDPSAREALSLAKLASDEPDAEIAVDAWNECVRLAGVASDAGQPLPQETVATWLAARADCFASLRKWQDAEKAYGEAAEALAKVVASGANANIAPDTRPLSAQLAMAHDGRSIAAGAIGDWVGALEASRRATAAAGLGGLGGRDIDVPTTAFKAGMRGGAPTVRQRVEFDAAMARWGAGDAAGAAAALDRLDFGPEPDAGFPQFWEARAALAVALWASGAKPRAEAEWSALCRPTKPNPPSTPSNGVKAAVNKAAQAQFEAYGVLMDKRCEDFDSGTPLPCDDAGIPGSGGSSAACGIFTVSEVENRLWPPDAVKALGEFLKDGPEFVLRASEMERGGK